MPRGIDERRLVLPGDAIRCEVMRCMERRKKRKGNARSYASKENIKSRSLDTKVAREEAEEKKEKGEKWKADARAVNEFTTLSDGRSGCVAPFSRRTAPPGSSSVAVAGCSHVCCTRSTSTKSGSNSSTCVLAAEVSAPDETDSECDNDCVPVFALLPMSTDAS